MVNFKNLYRELTLAGLPVESVSEDGKIDYTRFLTEGETVIQNDVLSAHDPEAPSLEALEEIARNIGKVEFRILPQWSSWTPIEGKAFINNQIFNGQTQLEIDAWIDTNVTTLASAKTALKTQAAEMLKIRADLAIMAQAVLYLRDIAVGKV